MVSSCEINAGYLDLITVATRNGGQSFLSRYNPHVDNIGVRLALLRGIYPDDLLSVFQWAMICGRPYT